MDGFETHSETKTVQKYNQTMSKILFFFGQLYFMFSKKLIKKSLAISVFHHAPELFTINICMAFYLLI